MSSSSSGPRFGDKSELFLSLSAFLVPLVFLPSLIDSFVLPKLSLAAVLCAASAIALLRSGGRKNAGATAVDAPLLALLACAVLSASISADPWVSWVGQYRFYAFGILGWVVCAAAFYCAFFQRDERFPDRLILWVLAGSLPVSAYAVAQKIGMDPYSVAEAFLANKAAVRATSTLGGAVQLGSYLALVIPLSLCFLGEFAGRSRLLAVAALGLALPALWASGSRGAWLGASGGALVFALLRTGAPRHRFRFIIGAALAALAGTAVLHFQRGAADMERLEVWKAAARMFRDRPVLGVGPDLFGEHFFRYQGFFHAMLTDYWGAQQDAHNDWLQILATLGCLGCAAYAWLHWRVLSAVLPQCRRGLHPVPAAALASLSSFFIQAKLNTMSWASLFVASILAGTVLSMMGGPHPREGARSRALVLGFAASCSLAAAVLFSRAWADHLERRGLRVGHAGRPMDSAVYLAQAVRWNPRETSYWRNIEALYWRLASGAQDIDVRRVFLRNAASAALAGLRYRPADAAAYHALGRAELLRCVWGGEDRRAAAAYMLSWARELAPYYGPVRSDTTALAEINKPHRLRAGIGPRFLALENIK